MRFVGDFYTECEEQKNQQFSKKHSRTELHIRPSVSVRFFYARCASDMYYINRMHVKVVRQPFLLLLPWQTSKLNGMISYVGDRNVNFI